MNRPAVVETDAAATVGVGAEDRETDMKHGRFAGGLQDFPDLIELPVARIKSLVRRMKFETNDLRIFRQLFGVARDRA